MGNWNVPTWAVAMAAGVALWVLIGAIRRWAMRPVREALEAMRRGDYRGAAQRFREFADGRPLLRKPRLSARIEAARALHFAGEHQAAIREVEAIDLSGWAAPLEGIVHQMKAGALLSLGRLDDCEREARLALQHAHRVNSPEDMAATEILLGAAALLRGRLASATEHVRPFLGSRDAQYAAAFDVMSDIHRIRGEFDEATRWAEVAMELASSLQDGRNCPVGVANAMRTAALYELAGIAAEREAWDTAEEHIRAMHGQRPPLPKVAAAANALLGLIYSAVRRDVSPDQYFDLAEQMCDMLPEDTPTRASVSALRGSAALYTGNYEKALEYLQRSLAEGLQEVWHPKAWYKIGLAHEARGEAEAAREAFGRAAGAGQPDHLHVKLARSKLAARERLLASPVRRPS